MEPTRDAILTQLRKGVVEYCALAALRSGPTYGRELAERLGASKVLLTSEGTLYPLLSRLRRQGWVSTSQRASPVGPPRRYYELTPEGLAALDAFTQAWTQFSTDVHHTLQEPTR
jgi:PadR family transcriptional regulator PadR